MPTKDGRFYTLREKSKKWNGAKEVREWRAGNRKDDYKLIERVRGEIDGGR